MAAKNSGEETDMGPSPNQRVGGGGGGGGERLKRHRMELAGQGSIPETWGQEESLKEWTDCTAFDKALANSRIMSARAALINDARLTSSNKLIGLRISNKC